MTNSPLIQIDSITKSYGHYVALQGLSFLLESGSLGLLGPNGAGKSTLIKILLGLLEVQSGKVEVLGYRLPEQGAELRQRVGYMPENDSYLPYMTAIQYVRYAGELCGLPRKEAFRRAHEVLEYVGLQEARYRELAGFSTGMKQRVKLAQALVHGPKLVFLDEPTNGLDPTGRNEMLDLLQDVKGRGISIVLSSHILPDVEKVCEEILMLHQGKSIYQGSLVDATEGGEVSIAFETNRQDQRFIEILKQEGYGVDVSQRRPRVLLRSLEQGDEILSLAIKNGIILRHFVPTKWSLETAFLQLVAAQRDSDHESSDLSNA